MSRKKAYITVLAGRDELERRWAELRPDYLEEVDAIVTFQAAPGDKGTELYVDLEQDVPGGKLGEMVAKALGSEPHARLQDDLRRFKQLVEAGEITRSGGSPEGQKVDRQLRQQPAQEGLAR